MKDYQEFQMTALVVSKDDVIPRYDETIFEDNQAGFVHKFMSWRTDIVQAVAKAASCPPLKEGDEMIIIVKKAEKEEGDFYGDEKLESAD